MQLEYKEQVMQLKLQIEKETKLRADVERQLHEWKYQRPVAANVEVCKKCMLNLKPFKIVLCPRS